MNVKDAIATKRAVRQFQEKPLPDEIVYVILNAGRRAQSSKNTQPWEFIVVRDRSLLKSLSECGAWAGHLANAAMAVVLVTPPPEQRFSIMFDAGQAAAYMQLAAWEMGIGSCLASIYETQRARSILGFPEERTARIALSFGFPVDESVLTKPPQRGGRRPLEQVVHWDRW